ncbi:MAG: methylenetetrahydrofolate reductase [NAD(P)H] [Ilumatobacter sp.]|nr:methylenetetrahydrofolate reductase [NAD(P)H] [Ilumatobacter sp.]
MTPSVSFEVFPPKESAGLVALGETVTQLAVARPSFVSVTYGAGGSDRQRSFDAIETVRRTGVGVAAHLTCVGQSRAAVRSVIARFDALGVRHIVALRGDPPHGIDAPYEPHPDGFTDTADLVRAIKAERADTTVTVSAYPERHPQSPSFDHDLDVLAAKVDAGAERAMTQMFFDNASFLDYRDRVRSRGIDVPIVPGIFPVHSFPAVARFAGRCGASIPTWFADRFAGLDDDRAGTAEVAAELAAAQIAELAEHGVEHVHLYTLNRAELALAVCERLGLVERQPA